jgi:hypothetical protein
MIDQQLAHERILFERFLKACGNMAKLLFQLINYSANKANQLILGKFAIEPESLNFIKYLNKENKEVTAKVLLLFFNRL